MIRISQIDDGFTIFNDSVVILLGLGSGTNQILDLYKQNEINIDYFCDNNKENFGKSFYGIPVISPEKLQKLASLKEEYDDNIVVQISINNINKNIEDELKKINISKIITFDEAFHVFNFMKLQNLYLENPHFAIDDKYNDLIEVLSEKSNLRNLFIHCKNEFPIILCLPAKTGDYTLVNTLKKNNISFTQTSHKPMSIDKYMFEKNSTNIKIITAIREPIIQDISTIYQHISILIHGNYKRLFKNLSTLNNSIFENGGDAQVIFDMYLDCRLNHNNDDYFIRQDNVGFFTSFKDNVLDLSQYPFDKEKGYTIIKDGNIEVFVYQLERMNDIVKEMSDWIGQTPFDKWVMGNEASSKWIANSYKQAQKDIKFSQEYFALCYNNTWVQHFYSQEDIEKFKKRWRPHIKEIN